ncbi:MAG: ATP-binding protein [Candidatus Saccharimonadales bacterium]
MKEGGSVISPRTAQILRYAGLLVPIVLVIYSALIQCSIINVPHSIDNSAILIFSFWWMYISILHFLIPSTSKLDSILRLIAYHLLASSYLIFIAGIASPFVACWLLLMIASYVYYSERGLQLSTLAFIVVVAVDIILWHSASPEIITYDLTALVAILMTSFVTMSVSRSQQISKKAFHHSKAKELLQRDRVLTIINNMADAVISTDKRGIIRIYNAASMSLLDTNDDLKKQSIDKVLPLINQEDSGVNILDEFKSAKTVVKRDDLSYVYNDGEKIRLEITYAPIRSSYNQSKKSETNDGYVIIMRDITKAKSLEEERDEFIGVISHELRTPITIAEGTISNAQVMMDHPDVTTSMLKDSVNLAHDQVIFLANMVNDLSALSRAERGVGDSAEDIDIRELAHKLIEKYSESAKAKKLHLDLDLSAKLGKVNVSRLYLEELLQNFMTNAVKYTKEGNVKVIIKQSDNKVTFSVKDSGIGISKSDLTKIFQKFYRSEDYRTRETSGTGLGLYVAAKLARKLNTKIEVVSRLNHGSTFSITLPTTD